MNIRLINIKKLVTLDIRDVVDAAFSQSSAPSSSPYVLYLLSIDVCWSHTRYGSG